MFANVVRYDYFTCLTIILCYDFSFRSGSVCDRRYTPSLSYTGVNRYATDTRIGPME